MIEVDLGSKTAPLPNEWLLRGNGCSYTAPIPPVRLGGWDAEPPSGGSCVFWAFYQLLGLWIVPSVSVIVRGNWEAAKAAERIGL
jgi:hypothetical protein